MPTQHRASLRPATRLLLSVIAVTGLLAACGNASPTPQASVGASASPTATPTATPSPTPTPLPTPRYTNPPDPDLAAIIPGAVAGETVTVPPVTDFALTPGDIGEVYGEVGLRFTALQVAFIAPRKLSLYAMRMDQPYATTQDLEPYLAAAGEYVGIAGLHRDPWELQAIGDHLTWVRPEDDATALGTMIYTWATDGYVFLMIGTDDALNRAMLQALPGETPPSPTPTPSRSPAPATSGSPQPTASAAAT